MPPAHPRRALVVAALTALPLAAACTSSGSSLAPSGVPRSVTKQVARLQLRVALERWQLAAPVSREVVLPAGPALIVVGGLTSGDVSGAGIYRLNPATGGAAPIGHLVAPLHDAAGLTLGGRDLVAGGGAASSVATVQAFAPGASAVQIGRLPTVRSDLVAATVRGTGYLLGGYDGVRPVPDVLATTDGHTFRVAGQLPVPVRYPATVTLAGQVWLFGGQSAAGPVDDIQRFDPATGKASVVGHLPTPLSDATAGVLDGAIVVAGGRVPAGVSDRVYRVNPVDAAVTLAARLPRPVANAGGAVIGNTLYLVGGEDPNPVDTVQQVTGMLVSSAAAVAAWPFDGRLLIADRGNNRLVLVDPRGRVLWTYPSATAPPPPGGFYFPDDAFFVDHGRAIITNQEGNDTIVELAFPSGKVLWAYGHPRVPGAAAGFLNQPDDAYVLRDGTVTVADASNCRILFIRTDRRVAGQIGRNGVCRHDPPVALSYPNGDTPLANGDVLVSEVNGSYITELTPTGRLVWTVHLPIAYPSDPQQLGPDRYLVADYARPGGMFEFTREGRILWRYQPASGPGMLDHPSLAEVLPNGLLATNDDYRDRVVIIDPRTDQIVWQYGRDDVPGTGANLLSIPDGFDLLAPDGSTPTHPQTR